MNEVGNDIVAYKHKRCIGKWKDTFFLQKILQPAELIQLQSQTNRDAYLWMLWTLKEAAYKLSCFLGNRNKFHAIQYEVDCNYILQDSDVQNLQPYPLDLDAASGFITSKIMFDGVVYFGATLFTNEFVHSHVTRAATCSFHGAIHVHSNYNKNDFSTEVRSFAKQFLSGKNILFDYIEKDGDGIPFVTINGKPQYLSLSHDQQFVSVAFAINE